MIPTIIDIGGRPHSLWYIRGKDDSGNIHTIIHPIPVPTHDDPGYTETCERNGFLPGPGSFSLYTSDFYDGWFDTLKTKGFYTIDGHRAKLISQNNLTLEGDFWVTLTDRVIFPAM